MSRYYTAMYTDRQTLTAAYDTSAPLAARQAIYRYQQPLIDFLGWALGQVPWRGGERVLDIGCGNGGYLRRLAGCATVLGCDQSRGMLAEVAAQVGSGSSRPLLVVADAMALPLPAVSCDVALAMHMLYHVPDIALAIRELRRVLRPGGVLLAATNADDDKQAIDDAFAAALAQVAGAAVPTGGRSGLTFTMERGAALLQRAFDQVERHDITSTLVITDAAPLLAYIDSMRALCEPLLPASVSWQALMAEVALRVTATITAHGAFHAQTHAGVFVCR
jgi:ubiquinone/menaquinone biosynthesis C-methylase UbiE